MNTLINLYHLQSKYDRLNELKREDRKIKLHFSHMEASAKLKFVEWKKMQKTLENLQKILKDKEIHMKDLEHQTDEYTKSMYSNRASKNPKELSDLQKKIQILKENLATVESDVIESMNQVEIEEKHFRQVDADFNRLKQDFNKENAWMKARTQEITQEIRATEDDIQHSREGLSQELLDAFDHAFLRGQQSAVVYVQGAVCSGCGTTLSRRLIDSVHRNPGEIHYCENCHRILVRKND
ncbi:MAG: C4-type zinc ribbon domain-containing protein [Caldisericia bacterium]|nr:C4-type zinc ribbon domain-containing protein [Caldisericia bacterium]MDD4614559.1 C4-type zinc ribbon domain-containing protein [Caldisericia bacterium]